MKSPFFTIGHSNRGLHEFIGLLTEAQIALVADIRRIPKSRTNPQYNADTLGEALADFGISYQRIESLGGLRGKVRHVPIEMNGYWENKSFHNYADYTLSTQFNAGLESLIEEGHLKRVAIMCSEAVWWRCHRRIVADHLIAKGEAVIHIMGEGRLEPANLTAGAIIRTDGTLVYPAAKLSID